ncbi:MAG: hypothetical protein GY838_07115 [bacterium]|nr:hypothetical protein [bacterium]
MDWNGTIETVRNASSLYWVAATAIAGGTSLLAAAFVLHLRRRVPGRVPAPAAATAPPPVVVPVAGGYAPTASATLPKPAPGPDLTPVTARLASLADRLEAVQSDLAAASATTEGSFLKETPSHVEYVFRTGEA